MNASNLPIVLVFGLVLALIVFAFAGSVVGKWTSAQAAATIAGITLAGALGYFRFLYTWEFRPAVNLAMDLQVVHNDKKRLAVLARIVVQNPTRVGAEVAAQGSEFSTRAAMMDVLPVGTSDAHTFFRPRPRYCPFPPLDKDKLKLPVVQGARYDPMRSGVGKFHEVVLVPQGTHTLIAWGIFTKGGDSGLRSSGAVVVEAAFRVNLTEPEKWRRLLMGAPVKSASDVFTLCVAGEPFVTNQ